MYGARPVGTKIFCLYYRGFLNLESPLREVPPIAIDYLMRVF